jgi:hypothetical protein
MKRLTLLTILVIFACNITAGQWYFKDYGVQSLNELTKSELEGALHHCQSRQSLHLVISGVSVAMLVTGIVLYNNSMDLAEGPIEDPDTWAGGMGVIFGVGFIVWGAILAPVGLIGTIVQSDKIADLKEALGSPDLKLGMLNYPVNAPCVSYYASPAFGVTLTFHF